MSQDIITAEGDLFPTLGAQSFAPPPRELRQSLTESIKSATSDLKPGEKAVVGQLTKAGFYGAFVLKSEDDTLDLMLWIGQEGGWQEPNVGVGFGIAKKWK
jgi:hypothetical protein